MEKIKYVPLALLVSYSLKALVVGASLADFGFMALLTVLTVFYEHKTEKKVVAELRSELQEYKAVTEKALEINRLAIENTFKQMGDLKGFVNSVKMNSTIPNLRSSNAKNNVAF